MSWSTNTNIVAGLPDVGTNSRVTCFIFGGDLLMVVGNNNQTQAFKWNTTTSQWDANTEFATFDGGTMDDFHPNVFEYNSELYLITGRDDGTFLGYKWSTANNQWETDSSIIVGLSDLGGYTLPNVFEFNSELYLIIGNSLGEWYGFKWSVVNSQWETDSSIISGLTYIGGYNASDVFFYEDNMYMIVGGASTAIDGFLWNSNTSAWEKQRGFSGPDGFFEGITSQASYSKPSYFVLGNKSYIILGNSAGTFDAFETDAPPPPTKLDSVSTERHSETQQKVSIVTNMAIPEGDTFNCYVSTDEGTLISAGNLVSITKINDNLYEAVATIEGDIIEFFVHIDYTDGTNPEELTTSGTHYKVVPINTTTINITNADNYIRFSNPAKHSLNHGSIFLNGYIYGTSRNWWNISGGGYTSSCIVKINAADYSDTSQITIYKNNSVPDVDEVIADLEQVVYCKGYLWAQGFNYDRGYLVRIDPATLDFIVFDALDIAGSDSEPIGTDGTYLYVTADSVNKLDTDLLLGTAASYGYDGTSPVALPANVILGSTLIIQHHPTNGLAFLHSIITDGIYIYVAATSGGYPNGYDSTLDVYQYHLQKIRISDMQTVGDVIIPKCTDDMVQNGSYVFLAPEYQTTIYSLYGEDWGLLAIHKQTLEIKYLKALHADFYTDDVTDRQAFGVFYFNDKITVQLIKSKKTVVVDISEVDQWGENYPIGGATDAIFNFQLNGVDFDAPCNELNLDNSGNVHTNTWEEETLFFKFSLSELTTAEKTPIIQTTLISSTSNNATIGGFVIDEGESPITDVGFRYGTDPELLNINVDVSPDTYDFQTILNSLTPGIYYIQAWGVNTEGTWYGNTVVFSTYNEFSLSNEDDDALLEWVNENFGCSIRCVQDAPGVADGVTGTATDQDGNTYNTIVINQKRWFVENLKVTTYRDGTPIPEVTSNSAWAALTDGGRCSYENE